MLPVIHQGRCLPRVYSHATMLFTAKAITNPSNNFRQLYFNRE